MKPTARPLRAESLPRSGFPSAAELLADAFFDNPAHVYLLPDESRRLQRLRWLLARNLGVQQELGRSFCLLDERRSDERRSTVDAMGFWHPPGAESLGLARMLRHGLLLAPFRLGLAATRRMIEATEAIEQARRRAEDGSPAWYLNNMVVRKSLRGSGIGSRLLGEQLRAVVDPSGQAAVLATQRPENVVFYTRLGFEVVSEQTVGAGERAFHNWILRRPPAPPRPARAGSAHGGPA